MTTIRSTWTHATPPPLSGLLAAADWSGAARMAIPRGTLLAQNDATHLYIGLDLTAETGAPDPSDYFWLIVDVNDNGVIDSHRDKLFSDWPGAPDRLGMWLMAGPDATWPASNTQVIPSQLRSGHGPSMDSPVAHRQWQIAFALSDLDIVVDPSKPAPVVRFGLRIASSSSVGEDPANPLGDFSHFNEIILSTVPSTVPGSAGPIVASIGLIGTGLIAADGYCNVPSSTPGYFIQPQDAAFSGTLNMIGNQATLAALWAAGARKYQVMRRSGATLALATAAPWAPILQSWSNFQIVGTTDVWQSFAPDAGGFYTLVDPALPYTIQNLIFQWTSTGDPDGVHQFQLQFFNVAGGAVSVPATTPPQLLTLKLDNQPVTVDLINVLNGGAPVSECAIVNLTAAAPGVQIVYEAFDPEGDLWSYALIAEYGHGHAVTLFSDDYTHHVSSGHVWQGLATDTQPPAVAGWVPPTTCAYLFQISAWKRTTNGYAFPVLESTDFQTVTLIKPNLIFKPILAGPVVHAVPAGFEALPTGVPVARTPVKALKA